MCKLCVPITVPVLELLPMGKFHAQIWQFWKMANISETAARRAKISSISNPWGRKRVYVQLLDVLSLAKFHGQLWQFWKSVCISETTARRAKKAQFRTPWVERECLCNFANNPCASFSVLYQNWRADLEFACKFCVLACICILLITAGWQHDLRPLPPALTAQVEQRPQGTVAIGYSFGSDSATQNTGTTLMAVFVGNSATSQNISSPRKFYRNSYKCNVPSGSCGSS